MNLHVIFEGFFAQPESKTKLLILDIMNLHFLRFFAQPESKTKIIYDICYMLYFIF